MTNRRDMAFVDGSNFLRQLSKKLDVPELRSDKPPPSTAMALAKRLFSGGPFWRGGSVRIRTYWYGSIVGNDKIIEEYAQSVRQAGFEPRLFKQQEGREKGVDLGLAKDVLVNAFNRNFDRAILVAGDGDYVELVLEAKRYGGVIDGEFFETGMSPRLRVAFDHFELLDKSLTKEEWDGLAFQIGTELSHSKRRG